MKETLLILSDLWGALQSDWQQYYHEELSSHYTLNFYDVRGLAELNLACTDQSKIHQGFIEGGIERAVKNLLALEVAPAAIIGFSVGGTIAWKAALRGLPTKELFLISATRIRYETEKPSMPIHLYFGENDLYQPHSAWLTQLHLKAIRISGADHEFYREPKTASLLGKHFKKLP